MPASVALFNGRERYFSDKLPDELKLTMHLASTSQDYALCEQRLRDAFARWPQVIDISIALYKLYFRTGRYRQAECQVWTTLRLAARLGGFSRNYHRLHSDSADWLEDHSIARLYLFSLKALGVVRLRQGKVMRARQVLRKLEELDPQDEIGGGNFLMIAESFDADDLKRLEQGLKQ